MATKVNINKRLIFFIVFILIVFSVFIVLSNSKKKEPAIVSKYEPSSQAQLNPAPTVSAELQIAIDEAKSAARQFDDWQAIVRTDYPWLRKLPLAGEKYFVYFDLEKNSFIGRLYPNPGDNIEALETDIVRQLKEVKEIPVENYKFTWTVFPR